MTALPLRGVFPVLQTPFDGSGAIDAPVLHEEIGWVFDCGAHGVTVAMVSELLRLSHSERLELTSLVCAASGGRGGDHQCRCGEHEGRRRFAEHAQSVGAAAVMAIPPLSVAALDGELEGYYDAIVAAVDVPVVVQDASSYVGAPIPIELLARLHDKHADRVDFKPEAQPIGPRLSALLAGHRRSGTGL